MPCPFKDIFGAPGTGVHSVRLFGLAIMDVVFTIVASIIIAYVAALDMRQWLLLLAVFFASGIVLHRIFCVNTRLNVLIFGVI